MRSRFVLDATGPCHTSLLLSLTAGLALLAPAPAPADTAAPLYKTERVIQSGDAAGGVGIPSRYNLFVGGLSDTGQIIFSAGWQNQSSPERLFQYAGGKLTPIVMSANGSASPGDVNWPNDVTIARPLGVNKSGNTVFSAGHIFGNSPWGTFLWNAATGHTTAVALKDMPATAGLTFVNPGGYAPAINSSNEIALIGRVKDAALTQGWGLFRLGRDGVLEPVARPHETLTLQSGEGSYVWDAGGSQISIDEYPMPSIDDSGRIAFLAHPDGSGRRNAYLWAHNAVSPILTVGAGGPVGDKFTSIQGVYLNSQNAWALVAAATDRAASNRIGLYRVVNGQSAVVAAPGQAMPGGGKLGTVLFLPVSDFNQVPSVAVSAANFRGEHVFLATLNDGTPAVYKIDQYGGLSLVAKGDFDLQSVHVTATLSPLSFVPGSRPSLNSRGQIAVSIQRSGSPDTLVLLTPQGS